MIDQPAPVRYATFIYWALQVASSGAYGDISAIAPSEKVFEVLALLLFRVYFAFVAAEAANIVSAGYGAYADNLEKKKVYEQWMRDMKLSKSIVQRVRKFNDYIWNEYHGLNTDEILNELPSTTKHDIHMFLLKE